MAEAVDCDAHRHAGGAAPTRRTVRKTMATAEAGARQIVVKKRRATPAELDDQFALGPARHVGAADRRRGEELPEGRDRDGGVASRSRLPKPPEPLSLLSVFDARRNLHPQSPFRLQNPSRYGSGHYDRDCAADASPLPARISVSVRPPSESR